MQEGTKKPSHSPNGSSPSVRNLHLHLHLLHAPGPLIPSCLSTAPTQHCHGRWRGSREWEKLLAPFWVASYLSNLSVVFPVCRGFDFFCISIGFACQLCIFGLIHPIIFIICTWCPPEPNLQQRLEWMAIGCEANKSLGLLFLINAQGLSAHWLVE